ncbi:epidermal growth factor-like protein 8 [Glandiceps talaboti]
MEMKMGIYWITFLGCIFLTLVTVNGTDVGSNVCLRTLSRTELVPEIESTRSREVDYVTCGECHCETCPIYRIIFRNCTRFINRTRYYTDPRCCDGWKGRDCDIPVCRPRCGEGQTCTAPDTCTCQPGYELNDDGECEDIDECEENNGGCEHDCENTEGSYHCECDEGYRLGDDGRTCEFQCDRPSCKCLGCIRYEVNTEEVTWQVAKERCEAHGGQLAMLKTSYIHNQIREYILSNNLHLDVAKGFWFGLTDLVEEGAFKWEDGTLLSDTGFTKWSARDDNPNNNTKRDPEHGQDCVQMWKAENLDWDDDYCGDFRREKGYICQFNICRV